MPFPPLPAALLISTFQSRIPGMFDSIVMLTILSNPCLLSFRPYRPEPTLSEMQIQPLCPPECGQTEFNPNFLLRHVTGATMTGACRESKLCTPPCRCRCSTTDTRTRATNGCRSSSALTLKTSLTRSSWTLPIKSTRGINEEGGGV